MAVAGNYLVFRAPVDRDDGSGVYAEGQQHTWDELLEHRAIKPGEQPADTRLIPLPTSVYSPKRFWDGPIRRKSWTSPGSGTGTIHHFPWCRPKLRRWIQVAGQHRRTSSPAS
jgi:hypothetical protein